MARDQILPAHMYRDVPLASPGCGHNIASVHEDNLDRACLSRVDLLVDIRRRAAEQQGVKPVPTIVLDIGGGDGAMTAKIAKRGAAVTLVDPVENPAVTNPAKGCFGLSHAQLSFVRHVRKSATELQGSDILGFAGGTNKVDVIYSQRALHYMPYADALQFLRNLRENCAAPYCKIFLSVSNANRETAFRDRIKGGWKGMDVPITDPRRHAVLRTEHAQAHNLTSPMTLYRKHELGQLLIEAGFQNVYIQEGSLGTNRVIAENPGPVQEQAVPIVRGIRSRVAALQESLTWRGNGV